MIICDRCGAKGANAGLLAHAHFDGVGGNVNKSMDICDQCIAQFLAQAEEFLQPLQVQAVQADHLEFKPRLVGAVEELLKCAGLIIPTGSANRDAAIALVEEALTVEGRRTAAIHDYRLAADKLLSEVTRGACQHANSDGVVGCYLCNAILDLKEAKHTLGVLEKGFAG